MSNRQIYKKPHNDSETLIFIDLLFSTTRFALRTQLQGSTHTVTNSTRPLCTQLQSLYLSTNTLDSDLQTLQYFFLYKPITVQIKIASSKKLTSNHRTVLYLYVSMVYGLWAGRLILHYFWVENPLT